MKEKPKGRRRIDGPFEGALKEKKKDWKISIRITANKKLEDIEIAIKNGMGMKLERVRKKRMKNHHQSDIEKQPCL